MKGWCREEVCWWLSEKGVMIGLWGKYKDLLVREVLGRDNDIWNGSKPKIEIMQQKIDQWVDLKLCVLSIELTHMIHVSIHIEPNWRNLKN